MPADYQKLYAYLVGQVDEALDLINLAAEKPDCGKMDLFLVSDKLEDALLKVEEMHLKAEE